MTTELKTYSADVTFTLNNVKFEAPEDTAEWMLKEMALEKAANRLLSDGSDSEEVDLLEDEE